MATFEIRKNWLLGQAVVECEYDFTITPPQLSRLVDGFLRSVLPVIPRDEGAHELLRDYKGRGAEVSLLPDMPVVVGNELFRLWGEWGVVDQHESNCTPVEVVLTTPFHAFAGTHHIAHAVQEYRTGALPPWLPTSLLGYAVPLRPLALRFGLERFRSLFTFASIGYVPTVVDSLVCDVRDGRGVVRVTHECKLRDVALDPFAHDLVLSSVVTLLTRVVGVSLSDEYRNGISSH